MPPNLLSSILSSLQRADVVYLVVSRMNLNLSNIQLKKKQFNKQLWAMTYFLYRRAPFSNLKYFLLFLLLLFLGGYNLFRKFPCTTNAYAYKLAGQ